MCDKFGWKIGHIDNFYTFSPNEIFIYSDKHIEYSVPDSRSKTDKFLVIMELNF